MQPSSRRARAMASPAHSSAEAMPQLLPQPSPASSSPSPRRRRTPNAAIPTSQLLLTTVAMAGIQVCYAAQFNLVTSHLLHLQLPVHLVSLAWLAGPVSGLLVQPIVGCASDACTHPLGRRRPFLIVGAALTAIAMVVFAHAEPIANFFVRVYPTRNVAPRLALCIAIAAFFVLDFAVQAVQAPLRALLTDVVPPEQLASGNACIGMFTGMGNLIGSLLAGTHLSPRLATLGIHMTDVQIVFVAAAAVLLACVATTAVSTQERPHRRAAHLTLAAELLGDNRRKSVRARIARVLVRIPRPFWRVFSVQLCTWCGFFTLFVFLNAWVGTNVFLGNPTSALGTPSRLAYEKGVRLGGMGNALTAVITMTYSALLPRLLVWFGLLPVYVFSQLVEAVCLMTAFFIRGTPGVEPSFALQLATVLDIGGFGVVWATTMSVPWTLIGRALESDPFYQKHYGLFTTLFNASQSFPQLVVAFVAPFILGIWNDSAAVMLMGGVCALIGGLLIVLLRVDREACSEKKNEEDTDSESVHLAEGGAAT